ncbi:MAG TPA: GNAT family N-acetyltransferase [Gaiellaceae bacterium]|nr:GNAT family N-acetyltransferase [Gaiellaceae bacterium]HET8652312.1 GNAT family N-acetyltransferase [Gaiellaceae bacterium]
MIREADTREDLAALCEIWAAITPREPMTPEQLLRRKERQPERLYLLAEEEDRAVGLGFVAPTDSPNRTYVGVRVLPAWRGRGLGTALYERAFEHARSGGPEWLSTMVSEAEPEAVEWARRRGFEPYQQQVELLLRLRGDEQAPASPAGIEIVEVTPDLHRAAYALSNEAWEDLPLDVPVELSPFEVWLEEDMPGPIAFAAMDDGEMVGFAALIGREAPGLLEHGLTATRRSHRRRGIATALKRTLIAWAAASGYRELLTFTQDRNEGMQAINLALGYEEQPAWISMRRRP